METIKLEIELKYNAKIMHENNRESIDWFYKDILMSRGKNGLTLHSNEIGDEIGAIKVLKILSIKKWEKARKKYEKRISKSP